jgi:hypothetical protein
VDGDGKAVVGHALDNLRRQQAVLWLGAWKRLEASIDKNWDPEDLPVGNVTPPLGTGLPAGVAPEAIEDPELRAQYIADIEANRRKAAEYRVQADVRDLQKHWIPWAKHFLIDSYMAAPDRTEELQTLLDQYVGDAADKRQIVEAVKNKKMPEDLPFKMITTQPAQ